jgi:transcriptional/translational regulatory protein YebC/TACO1
MSGHSKWATTKHKKAIIDSRRAKSFAKLIKNIEVAARMGGPDLAGNPGLELAVTKAKKTSVPNDNIDRAIKRGAGLTGEVVDYTEIMYECRGPHPASSAASSSPSVSTSTSTSTPGGAPATARRACHIPPFNF